MLTLDEALQRLIANVRPLSDTETLDSFDALGRVLAEPVRSSLDVPPADNTSMDGYALRCADVPASGTVLPVSQRIPAGAGAAAPAARHRGPHLHRCPGPGRGRCGGDAGAV